MASRMRHNAVGSASLQAWIGSLNHRAAQLQQWQSAGAQVLLQHRFHLSLLFYPAVFLRSILLQYRLASSDSGAVSGQHELQWALRSVANSWQRARGRFRMLRALASARSLTGKKAGKAGAADAEGMLTIRNALGLVANWGDSL